MTNGKAGRYFELVLPSKGLVPFMQLNIMFLMLALGAGAALELAAPSASHATAGSVESAKETHAAAIANCEAMWDRATHMTRKEWSRTCRRVQTRLQQLELK